MSLVAAVLCVPALQLGVVFCCMHCIGSTHEPLSEQAACRLLISAEALSVL